MRPNFEQRLGICYDRSSFLPEGDTFLLQLLDLIEYRGVLCDSKEKKWILFYLSENLLYQDYEENPFLLSDSKISPFIFKLDEVEKTHEEWQFNLSEIRKRLFFEFAKLNVENDLLNRRSVADFLNEFFFRNRRFRVGKFLCLYYDYDDEEEFDFCQDLAQIELGKS